MNDIPASVYDLIFRTIDYEGAARRVNEIVQQLKPGARTLLDVGCGAGRHLEYLSKSYEVEGVDLSNTMLRQARERLPAVPIHKGNMIDFSLGHFFDAVICLSSSIAYMTTVPDLRRAVANMTAHLTTGGVLIIEPWDSPEGHQSPDEPYLATYEEPGRKIAMLENGVWHVESHYLIGTPERTEHFVEHVQQGAFTHAENISAFENAGLDVSHDPVGLLNRGLYIGVRRLAV